ncbi:unnamed protein product, partial [Tetraodon nigroviridis]
LFGSPPKPTRDVPPVRVIEKEGEYEISHGPSGVSRLLLVPGLLPPEEADWIFSKLLAELPWSQKTNYRQGEAYEEPRLTCWYGELPYTYSRSTMAANAQWPALLQRLREAVAKRSGCSFNSLLCNLYRDGRDSIGWHSDDEASLGRRPTIASLSLGDTRVFSLRKIPPPVRREQAGRGPAGHAHPLRVCLCLIQEEEADYTYVERIQVPLSHGTLLLMSGSTQDDWQRLRVLCPAPGGEGVPRPRSSHQPDLQEHPPRAGGPQSRNQAEIHAPAALNRQVQVPVHTSLGQSSHAQQVPQRSE